MNIGEVISAIMLCASSLDDDKDHLLLMRAIYSIDVEDDHIEIQFVDGNTTNIKVYPDGRKEYIGYDD